MAVEGHRDASGGGSSASYQHRTVTAASDTLAPVTDTVISVNRAGAVTINLPSASAVTSTGKVFIIKDISGDAAANNITLDLDGTDAMDGSTTNPVINVNYGAVAFYSNGANWFIV